MKRYVLTVTCPSQREIVAATATYLSRMGCNITDSAQFDDRETGQFFMRMSFRSEEGKTLAEMREGFQDITAQFDFRASFHDQSEKPKVVIMVSRHGHCLNDLLYRWRIGALAIDIAAVISNHLDYQKLVVNHDIPYHFIRVTKDNKAEAEAQQMRIIAETGAELVILARYMQVLSQEMCQKMQGRIINIHHSFLPSFKGANPYRQAFERGVKLIGATSHYVTTDLDEGPIIEQDIVRVTHAQSASDYISLGRDVESVVLARAIHAHIHRRVMLNGDKTIVFPASPDSFASHKVG